MDLLQADERIEAENIFIIGHSLGGQLAPVILNRDESINGAIMLAGTPVHLLDVLMEQIKKQSVELYDEYLPIYDHIRNLKVPVAGQHNYVYFGYYQFFWVDYNLIDIEDETFLASEKHPLLIMQGDLDLQVSVKDFKLYKDLLAENNDVVFKLYEGLNHCFVDGEGETINNAYKKKKMIPEYVFVDIYDFIENNRK